MCPAIKLANNRTPKLIGLKMYETNSIGTNNKASPNEVLAGINNDNISDLWILNPIIFTPMKIENDIAKVTIKWLVIVKLYGINPIKFTNKINKNSTEIKGKYFSPFTLMLSNNN